MAKPSATKKTPAAKKPAARKKTSALNNRDALLLAVLADVPFDGWTMETLAAAPTKIGLPASAAVLEFPGGINDVLVYFGQWAEQDMLNRIQKQRLINLKIHQRVELCVKTWFDVMAPHKECVRLAVQSAWQPTRGLLSLKHITTLCNTIWYECGDNATDFNYYTKRALLAGVIGTTLAFWLNDQSDNHEKTWEFLSARIQNVLTIGKSLHNLKGMASNLNTAADFMQKTRGASRR